MKTNNTTLAYNFGNDFGNCEGSNMFIEGNTIFSYGFHFPIAKRVYNSIINFLFTTDRYSNTTAKHKSYVLGNLKGNVLFIRGCDVENLENQYLDNIETIKENFLKLGKAKKENRKDGWINAINDLIEQNKLILGYSKELNQTINTKMVINDIKEIQKKLVVENL